MAIPQVIFEQGFHEHIRTCLHFEYLIDGIYEGLSSNSKWEHVACLNSIIYALELLDRTDLRAKFSQDIHRYLLSLAKFHNVPGIDQDRLRDTEAELGACLHYIHKANGKFAQELRDDEFIHSLARLQKQQGGIYSANFHEFGLWLQQSPNDRRNNLEHWLASFNEIQDISQLLLKIIRASRSPEKVVAKQGFYQKTLNLQQPYQLVRIFIDAGYRVFPKINIGRHGLSIRFYDVNQYQQAPKTMQDIEFDLVCGEF